MRYVLVDGNNLIHKIPGIKKLFSENPESAQYTLYETVKSALGKQDSLILVFDGFSSIKSGDIIFSGKATADEVIRKYIEDYYDKKNIAVVSSDNGILSIAKACGCEILRSEDFIAVKKKNVSGGTDITADNEGEKPEGMSRKDFDFYKKHFS